MGTAQRFEDILAWQKARVLTNQIYEISSKGNFAKDFPLRDQTRRASISVMANIAEGFGKRTNKEFAQYLNIAHGSVAEVQSLLYIALDQRYIEQNKFNELHDLAREVSSMVLSWSKYLLKESNNYLTPKQLNSLTIQGN